MAEAGQEPSGHLKTARGSRGQASRRRLELGCPSRQADHFRRTSASCERANMTEISPFLPGFAPVCPRCGADLVVQDHHKNWNHSDNRARNRERICEECHIKEHREGFDGLPPYVPAPEPDYRVDRPGPPATRDAKRLAAAHWGGKKEDACERHWREAISARAKSKTMDPRK